MTIGAHVADSATLSGGFNPTGTIVFSAYGPGDANCTGTTAFTTTVTVAGNGTYPSASFTPTVPGSYNWVVAYSGDTNNVAVTSTCGSAGETSTVNKANPTIVTTASGAVAVGGTISDSAVLASGVGPTGTITFKVYGPNDTSTCTATPAFMSSTTVAGNGTYGSAAFTTTAAGTYQFVAVYSGDANNAAFSAACGAANESVNVTRVTRVVNDFDGDGKSDVAVFRPSNGTWYISLSGGGTMVTQWGTNGDIPVPGDYDGDGKTDLAVFRPSNGTWYIDLSGVGGQTITTWGTAGDVPVPSDYDGDGKTDLAVFRPSTGTWYISLSGGGTLTTTLGASGDVPVPGDYNGDGKSEVAVYHPASGIWSVQLTTNGGSFTNWGTSGDLPVVGDYDGDGKIDFTVFRLSNSTWYIDGSGGGLTFIDWGTIGDIPIGNPSG